MALLSHRESYFDLLLAHLVLMLSRLRRLPFSRHSRLLPFPKHLLDHAYHLEEQLVDQGVELAANSFDHAHDLFGEAAEAEDAEEKVDPASRGHGVHGDGEAHDTFDGVGGAAEVALDDVGGGFEDLFDHLDDAVDVVEEPHHKVVDRLDGLDDA